MTKHRKSIRALGLKYEQWCQERSLAPAFPIKPRPLAAFLVVRCREVQGSAKSLWSWISKLKSYSRLLSMPWLDESEASEVHLVLQHLEYFDQNPVRRVRPLTLDLLEPILNCDAVSDLDKTMLAVGHDSLMRGGELCSGLCAQDLVWSANRRAVTITLTRSKCHRKGGPQTITIRDYGPNSGIRWLRKHMNQHQLWTKPTSFLFPSSRNKSLDWNCSRPTHQLRYAVKRSVKLIGLNPDCYSGHSLRAGGATDLFRANVAYANIKKFGRWRSDAALIYYRDEDAVAEAAASGFASLVEKRAVSRILSRTATI